MAALALCAAGSVRAADPTPAAARPADPQEGITVYGRHIPFHDPRFKPAPTQPPPVAPDAEMRASHDPVTGAQLGQFGDAYQSAGPRSLNPANQDTSLPGTGGR